MSPIPQTITVVNLEADATLEINQDYRLMVQGLELTLPHCVQGDFIVIDPLIDQQTTVTGLVLPEGVSLQGPDKLNKNARVVLCATDTDSWAII